MTLTTLKDVEFMCDGLIFQTLKNITTTYAKVIKLILYFSVNMRYTVTVDTKTEERDGEVYLVITKVHHSYENDR